MHPEKCVHSFKMIENRILIHENKDTVALLRWMSHEWTVTVQPYWNNKIRMGKNMISLFGFSAISPNPHFYF